LSVADGLLVGAKVSLLLLGTAIALLAFFAYWRTGRRLMGYLFVGFVLIVLGSFWEGLRFQVLRWDLLTVHVVESAFVLTGLLMLARALRPRRYRR
jgi:NADH:ubiquinone oxidoreductase subunit K